MRTAGIASVGLVALCLACAGARSRGAPEVTRHRSVYLFEPPLSPLERGALGCYRLAAWAPHPESPPLGFTPPSLFRLDSLAAFFVAGGRTLRMDALSGGSVSRGEMSGSWYHHARTTDTLRVEWVLTLAGDHAGLSRFYRGELRVSGDTLRGWVTRYEDCCGGPRPTAELTAIRNHCRGDGT